MVGPGVGLAVGAGLMGEQVKPSPVKPAPHVQVKLPGGELAQLAFTSHGSALHSLMSMHRGYVPTNPSAQEHVKPPTTLKDGLAHNIFHAKNKTQSINLLGTNSGNTARIDIAIALIDITTNQPTTDVAVLALALVAPSCIKAVSVNITIISGWTRTFVHQCWYGRRCDSWDWLRCGSGRDRNCWRGTW